MALLITPPVSRRSSSNQIVGLAARTTNAAESNPATARIPKLWGQFMAEDWSNRLEQLGATGPTVAVYSAYESDHTGSYQLLVGRELRTSTRLPKPLEQVAPDAGSYLVFRCSGPLPQAVIDGWQAVWAHFDRKTPPARAYTFDFEIYDGSGAVEIWVAVRNP